MLAFIDPLHGDGYQFWSGIGSDLAYITAIAVFWRSHNCHINGCWRLAFHPHPDHKHPVCRKHYRQDGADQMIPGNRP